MIGFVNRPITVKLLCQQKNYQTTLAVMPSKDEEFIRTDGVSQKAPVGPGGDLTAFGIYIGICTKMIDNDVIINWITLW